MPANVNYIAQINPKNQASWYNKQHEK